MEKSCMNTIPSWGSSHERHFVIDSAGKSRGLDMDELDIISNAKNALIEAKQITHVSYGVNPQDLVRCIWDLLDIIDQKDGDITAIEDEFNDYKEFVEDNYRHKSAKEMGWE